MPLTVQHSYLLKNYLCVEVVPGYGKITNTDIMCLLSSDHMYSLLEECQVVKVLTILKATGGIVSEQEAKPTT